MNPVLPPDWETWSPDRKVAFMKRVKYNWSLWRRPEQWPPEDDSWTTLLYLGGRGVGKTRSGAEWVRHKMMTEPGSRIAIVAPTHSACRDVCFEGDSGLLNVIPQEEILKYNRSLGQLRLHNGSMVTSYSAGEPERLRGPQFHYAWLDELCAWTQAQATYDQLQLTLRLGAHPQTFITTTPKPIPLIIALVERAGEEDSPILIRRGSTFDNEANLAASALQELKERYGNSALGRQELYAELILDAGDANWKREWIESARVEKAPHFSKVIVAVDPCSSSAGTCGIVVAGRDSKGFGYVIEDCSVKNPTPEEWAQAAIAAFDRHRADGIIYERNHGGDMVPFTLRTVRKTIPLKSVNATRGKSVRAQPISALAEQGRIRHIGYFPELEDEMCMWTEELGKRWSPDRMDAAVWAFTELLLGGGNGEVHIATPAALGFLPRY